MRSVPTTRPSSRSRIPSWQARSASSLASITIQSPAVLEVSARRDRMRTLAVPILLVFGVAMSSFPVVAQDLPAISLYVNGLTTPAPLLADEFNGLEALCYQVDSLTSAEIAILVVNTTQPWGIDTFAARTFSANGLGKAGRDNGVLLVVSTDERAWRFEVGYGLEGILNDALVGRIGRDNLTPALQSGDFFEGIYDATYVAGSEIVSKYDGGSANPEPSLLALDWKVVAVVVIVFLAVSIVTRGRSFLWIGALFNLYRRGGFGGGRNGGGGGRGQVRPPRGGHPPRERDTPPSVAQ